MKIFDFQSLPKAASHFPFSLILGCMPQSARPDEAQKIAFRAAAQRTDVLADNLVTAMRSNSAEGRRQFEEAVEHGITRIENPSPELAAFFAAMDETPYWVDQNKIRRAQEVISGLSMTTIQPILLAFGLPASYIASKVNQTLIRSGDLELKAGGRFIETVTWLMHCTVPGGLERDGAGFKSTARVRLIHGYMRSGLNRLPEWDYANWDRPINQAQQALTMLPFLIGTMFSIALGNPCSRADIDAILHLYRYISHLMGIESALQITSFQELRKMLWLTAWAEVETDESTPVLNRALQNAIPAIYGVPKNGMRARLLTEYHSSVARLTLGKHYCDALGFSPLGPMILPVVAMALLNGAGNLVARIVPGARTRVRLIRQRKTQQFLANAARRVAADLSFNRENARLNQARSTRREASHA